MMKKFVSMFYFRYAQENTKWEQKFSFIHLTLPSRYFCAPSFHLPPSPPHLDILLSFPDYKLSQTYQ